MEHWLTSVGIDIGTSTTKWILSRLKLTLVSDGSALPRYEIADRILAHVSPIYPTPLSGDEAIDVPAVVALLDEGYAGAGIVAEQVQTGAVLITGETATKRNAEQLAHGLARHAGPFVAAAAGADLEALLAGKGSGAQRRSLETDGIVANVDIGGGTANAVYFRRGQPVATATFHVGGRLVRLERSGRVRYAAPALKEWSAGSGDVPPLPPEGSEASFDALQRVCRAMSDTLLRCVCGEAAALAGSKALFVGQPAAHLPCPAEIWISGGVGALMEGPPPASAAETARFGDIGPLLAAGLAELAGTFAVPVRAAEQSARATVIGAGTQTAALSGATLYCSPGVLPLRNVPVVVCEWPPEAADAGTDAGLLAHAAAEAVARGCALYGREQGGDPPFALGLRAPGYVSYRRLSSIADALIAAYASAKLQESILLLVCSNDMAKSLGNRLFGKLGEPWRRKLVCLDQLVPQEGDYLDVGEPLREDVVPVIVKSLLFGG
ncbi:ethanolamine ammonia-lyase reactivating factor EutA [Paenibacillus glycinis]|uniref:ethanolamine ammonia-lyase reactivating factor EutA n=1 Tax=Paenibacillus glycinis TaxID=2697035 RepID=UPI002E2B04E4|nr:ethanolamine ammonia-lyase reactivating factor EutA [Paenibacillus glycinis]